MSVPALGDAVAAFFAFKRGDEAPWGSLFGEFKPRRPRGLEAAERLLAYRRKRLSEAESRLAVTRAAIPADFPDPLAEMFHAEALEEVGIARRLYRFAEQRLYRVRKP